jgi:hypothetical protein
MANEVLGDALGLDTTLKLPVREPSAREKVKGIEEDTTPVALTDPIPKPVPTKPKEKGTSAGETYKSDIQASVDALEAGRKAQFKLDSEKAIDEAERLAAKAYKTSLSSAQQRKEIEEDPARKEYKEALSEKAKPFIPHEENANDLMMLFGLLNVVGFAIGSGGKENAQAAMSAMNGMLEGNRKGREDLYKKEKSIFETNQKQLDSRIKQLQAFMQDNQLLYGMDKTARDQAIESEFLQTGATFMLEYYRKKGAGPTIELLEQTAKTMGEVSKLNRAEVVRAEDQAREDVQKADERKFRLDTAAQQENAARARAREDRLFQISVKEQELAAAEDRDRRNKTFESEMAVAKNRVDLAMQKENHRHAEAQSDRVINHAQAIEVERILAQKARDSQYAADRAQDKTEQSARDRATEAFRAEEQKARITAERLRLEHQKADDAHKARMEGFEKQRLDLERQRLGGIGKLDREVYNIATQNYAGVDPKDLSNLSKESVGRIVNGTRALEEVEDIAKFIKQKPQAVGAAAKFQNIINYDAIKSVVGESETTAGEKARIIDSQVDDAVRAGKLTSDEASSAKLLNKKLFSLALADVQSSGQRGSVYLDKAFQGLYDQASRPETLVAILADRAHQSNRNLANFGMQVENRKDSSRFDLTTKGGEQWMTENFPVLTPAKVRAGVAAGTLKNGDYFRTTDGRFAQVNVPAQR